MGEISNARPLSFRELHAFAQALLPLRETAPSHGRGRRGSVRHRLIAFPGGSLRTAAREPSASIFQAVRAAARHALPTVQPCARGGHHRDHISTRSASAAPRQSRRLHRSQPPAPSAKPTIAPVASVARSAAGGRSAPRARAPGAAGAGSRARNRAGDAASACRPPCSAHCSAHGRMPPARAS